MSTNLVKPSYQQGFAPNAGVRMYPGLWRNVVGAWPFFLGNTGATTPDLSGYGNFSSKDGGTWVSSPYGSALNFVSDNGIDCGSNAVLDDMPACSMNILVNQNALVDNPGPSLFNYGGNVLLSKAQGSRNWYWTIDNGALHWILDGSGGDPEAKTAVVTAANQWYSIGMSWNGSTTVSTGIKFYVNGRPVAQASNTDGGTRQSDAALPFRIGSWGGFNNHRVADVTLWDVVQPSGVFAMLHRDKHAMYRVQETTYAPVSGAPPAGTLLSMRLSNKRANKTANQWAGKI